MTIRINKDTTAALFFRSLAQASAIMLEAGAAICSFSSAATSAFTNMESLIISLFML